MVADLALRVLTAIVSIAVAAIAAKVVAVVALFSRGDLGKIPSPPGSLIAGHFKELTKPNFHRILSGWVGQYGSIFRFRVFGDHVVVVADPVAVGKVLGHDKDTREMPKSARTYQVLDVLWSNSGVHSIFTDLNTDMWRLVRKAVSPAFSSANVRSKFQLVLGKAERLADTIQEKGCSEAVDIDDAGMRLTLDVVGLDKVEVLLGIMRMVHTFQAGFGHDFGAVSLQHNYVISNLPPALEMCQQRMTNPFAKLLPTQEQHKGMRHAVEFQNAVKDVLEGLRSRGPPAEEDTSIGALLLKIVDPKTGKGLSDDQLQAEIGTMIMGGFETTAHTLAFTIFCLATNPEAEAAVVAELRAIGLAASSSNTNPRKLQHDDLRNMPRVTNAIKEAMRMYPVVAGFPRVAAEDCELGPYRIPKGVLVYVLFHALHNSPQLWEEPDAYRPDRWNTEGMGYFETAGTGPAKTALEDAAAGRTHVSASCGTTADEKQQLYKTFLPFSDGPRSCVGQAMAMMELKIAVAVLLSRFSFRLAPEMGGPEGVFASEIMALTLHTRHGIKMFCHPRA